ncbi:uncharacterized protein BO72DRAFT_244895 [Aspergillus fijiensis CBS 313.89]|uniref:Uncharacterized protein n=1 Tax=Aspergillus fijiensis CBS 313.89 TaxID=1448319 RepID=A0A8G1RJ12_9EURO|nr:uncharacterized protein BO72DRAFT_244895 [Aspergillus fijiensis CBS 313.89]RAK73302.1 hypothetical protein BO72DRAFT_244895 [Aspergillus fijiensis CBS 313.89]
MIFSLTEYSTEYIQASGRGNDEVWMGEIYYFAISLDPYRFEIQDSRSHEKSPGKTSSRQKKGRKSKLGGCKWFNL